MISTYLLALSIAQSSVSQKSLVWVSSESHANVELGSQIKVEASVEEIKKDLGIDVLRFEFEEVVVLVTDDAYPISSYKNSIEWLKNFTATPDSNFNPQSKEGAQLLDFLQSKFFADSIEFDPRSKPLGTTLGVIIKHPKNPNIQPHHRHFANQTQSDPARMKPFLGSIDEVTNRAQKESGRANLFPNSKLKHKLSITNYSNKKPSQIHSTNLLEVHKLLTNLTETLITLEQEHSNLLMEKINELGNQLFPGFKGASQKSISFNDLPADVKKSFEDSLKQGWKESGFSSEQDVEHFLSSNPELQIDFTLVAFLTYTQPNQPPGSTSGYAHFIKP